MKKIDGKDFTVSYYSYEESRDGEGNDQVETENEGKNCVVSKSETYVTQVARLRSHSSIILRVLSLIYV